jgi:6-phosphofructokinase 1
MKQRRLRVGILTSGGDAPGMNAVIRAAVRTALHLDMRVYGIKSGYQGLFRADVNELKTNDVTDIIHRGGTILRTARCAEMMSGEGQRRAAEVIKAMQLDAIIVVGGDGSFKGALALSELGIKVVCIPATIDLDMDCTDYTIGFDTAVNTAANAIIHIRDTSISHDRCSIVEVMGRNTGYLAVWCGMVGGAEEVIFLENRLDNKSVMEQLLKNRSQGRRHHLVVVAEGVGGSSDLAKEIESILNIETRATVLGHLQRGGTPSALDRMHASVMGYMAVKAIKEDEINKVVVYRNGKHELMDLTESLTMKKVFSPEMYEITKILAM